jgi:hypothetical protein
MSNRVEQRKLILRLKKQVKEESSFLEECEKYNIDPDFVDDVKVSFVPLDVSAKTINGEVFLNEKLLDSGSFRDALRYFCHENLHILQQNRGLVSYKEDKNSESGEDYLSDPNEIEAFQAQLDYMSDHYSEEEIQDYLEHLLDHHNIEGEERVEKAKELLDSDYMDRKERKKIIQELAKKI